MRHFLVLRSPFTRKFRRKVMPSIPWSFLESEKTPFARCFSTSTDDTDVKPLLSSILRESSKPKTREESVLDLCSEVPFNPLIMEDPKKKWLIDPPLHPHVRACRSDIVQEDSVLSQYDTGFSVITLGTGAGAGTKDRSNTASVLKYGSMSHLIDAGEGLQNQFRSSRLNYRDVQKIFITHMHGDHIFGLPGFLLTLQIASLNAHHKRPIEIYGPVGLYNYIAAALTLSCTELRRIKVDVYELHGGTNRSLRHPANRKHFGEFGHSGLFRRSIPQNEDGTWTLIEPTEITTPDMAIQEKRGPKGLSIKAAEIHHVPQLQCFGYTFKEPQTLLRRINSTLCESRGVRNQDAFKLLKAGWPVKADTGELIQPEQVCGPRPSPRKVTFLGDCCHIPPPMQNLARNSDVVVHEATLPAQEVQARSAKAEMGGHSSAAQGARFATDVKAKVLLLNHLPPTASKILGMRKVLADAERELQGDSPRVQLGYDHLEILVPRNGFDFPETCDTPKTSNEDESQNTMNSIFQTIQTLQK